MLLAKVGLVLGLAACGGESSPPGNRIGLEGCRRIAVEDPAGAPVIGIEDIAIDHARGLAYLSAHDRRAVDAALAAGERPAGRGGLYLLDLARPLGAQVTVRPLADGAGVPARLRRPHGIALDPAGGRLAAIERRYEARAEGGWRLAPHLARLRLSANRREFTSASLRPLPGAICSPNDLAFDGENILITSDHGRCTGAGRAMEDLLGLTGAFLARLGPEGHEIAVEGVPFANGIAIHPEAPPEQRLVLAASRARGLFFFPEGVRRRPAGRASAFLDLGAAPDNITRGPDGALYVAAHPSLMAFALYRAGWPGFAHSPTAVFRVGDGEAGGIQAERLVFDPEGAVISAATVAARYRDRLLIGAVYDAGLAVCDLGGRGGETEA